MSPAEAPEVIVFDMDGVLVEVSQSYREAIRETVRHFTGELVSHDEIQDFKDAGGWNNDWLLSQRLISDRGKKRGVRRGSWLFQPSVLWRKQRRPHPA